MHKPNLNNIAAPAESVGAKSFDNAYQLISNSQEIPFAYRQHFTGI